MTFALKDRLFEVNAAMITAAIADPHWRAKYDPHGRDRIVWGLEVQATQQVFDEEVWQPSVYHDDLPLRIRRWQEISAKRFSWEVPFSVRTGRNGSFYVFEHELIRSSTLIFGERSGSSFPFSWSGLCDVHWDAEFGESVPFAVSGSAAFESVVVHGNETDTELSFRSRLSQYLDPSEFIQQPVQRSRNAYEDGVRISHCVFLPT